MNGFDFNHRILKPWQRDPAFYKSIWMERSDVPAHEGPTHHGIPEVWQFPFPLSEEAKHQFLGEIQSIVPLNAQAKENLTGNAKELWAAGIPTIQQQIRDLETILAYLGIKEDAALNQAIQSAISSTEELVK